MRRIFCKDRSFYLLLIILLAATFLRFYNFPYRYSLGEETVRDAVIGIEGARQLQFPLTGAFSSLGPFTFGPWYAYQLIIFTKIFPYLYSPWIYLSIISIIYIFVIYKIGELIKGKNFGLILALIAALSPAQIISATHLTSHNNTNLFAVLAVWVFLKIAMKNVSYWWGLFLGLIIGIGINLHFQMSGLLILPLILLIHKRKRFIYFINAAVGVFISFLPLLFFEVNNHWFTTKNLFFYMLYGKNAMYVPNRWLFYVRDFWPSFWADALGTPVWVAVVVIILFLASLACNIRKKSLNLPMVLVILGFLFNFVLLRYYWGPRFFGYLNFLRPFVFIFTAFAVLNLSKTKLKYFGSLILLLLIFVTAFSRITSQLVQDPFTMRNYQAIEDVEKKYPNQKFTLYSCTKNYMSYYNATSFSTLFLLELKNKIGKSGTKIGIESDCKYPKLTGDNDDSVAKSLEETYPLISKTAIVDLSKASVSDLKDKGWQPVTFSSIYDSYARWWFRLQP